MPDIMFHGQRRGSSQPPSDFYLIPFHLVRLDTGGIFDDWLWDSHEPFLDIAAKTLSALDWRTTIARTLLGRKEQAYIWTPPGLQGEDGGWRRGKTARIYSAFG